MNKLEEYRDKKAEKYRDNVVEMTRYNEGCTSYDAERGYQRGFDAAIALDLPVKYNAWYLDEYLHAVTGIGSHNISEEGVTYLKSLKTQYFRKDDREPHVYQYWIDNIYKPE